MGKDLDVSRREFLGAAAAGSALIPGSAAFAAMVLGSKVASANGAAAPLPLGASPPAGFVPFNAPGRVVRVKKAGSLQPNQIYPKPEDAKLMLERVMTELTGKPTLVDAIKAFVHPQDKVCVKVNGIALSKMATNKELVLPFLEAMIAAGIPADQITVLEQYPSFLAGTRIHAGNVPKGVKVAVHNNEDATMDFRMIPGTGVQTKFVRVLTESTALINFSLVKDHSIAGYTGALKNMTHGCTINPHDFHLHHASPQIALMAAQDVLKSRMRLHIADVFKVTAHGGPLDKMPQYRLPYEAVMASTDPVAIDTVGWEIVEQLRATQHLRTLTAEGRAPAYIEAAGTLGLGVADRSRIQLKDVVA
ncbi:MAG TPA: DUF362 domain-containing protein [Polyangiaceae bacterium]|nr:DUF362 domain-containing protein [Polyangiaceae bacterium]